jgi:hypothetical protein
MSAISPPWPPSSTTLKWGLESNTGTFTSPLTKKTQMIARQGSRWHCTNELAYMNEDNARDWEGFFWLAQGRRVFVLLEPLSVQHSGEGLSQRHQRQRSADVRQRRDYLRR